MIDLFQEIYGTISRNKLRTLLTGFAVAWGIFMLIVLLGAGNGLINAFSSSSGDMIMNSMKIYPGYTTKAYKGLKEGRGIRLDEQDINITNSFRDNVESVGSTIEKGGVILNNGNDYVNINFTGVMPNYKESEPMAIVKGRFINKKDIEDSRKSIVLHENTIEMLFGKKDADVIGKYINANGLKYQIVGIYKDQENYSPGAFVPYSTLRTIYNLTNEVGTLVFITKNLNDLKSNDDFETKYRSAIASNHQFDPTDKSAIWIWNRMEQFIQQQDGISILKNAIWVVGLLTLLSGIVGVSNIMLITVKERTREFGIRKALGARPMSVLWLIISESIVITTIFGYIGMVAGIAATEYMNKVAGNQVMDIGVAQATVFENPTVGIDIAIQATLTLIIAGTLAGFFPARKAVMIKPIEALRAE